MPFPDYDSSRVANAPPSLVEIEKDGRKWEGVDVDAKQWCQQRGIDFEVYTLARYLKSEISSKFPNTYRAVILECLWNETRDFTRRKNLKWSAAEMLLHRTTNGYRFTRGKWGRQRGRWAATSLHPRTGDVVMAATYEHRNLARGGRRFFDSSSFHGARGHSDPVDFLRNTWFREGWYWVGPIAGINPYYLAVLNHDRKSLDDNIVKSRNEILFEIIDEKPSGHGEASESAESESADILSILAGASPFFFL